MSKKYSTTTTLVIVESPAKCKKIEEYLGPGYKCLATYGHLRELPSLKNIDVENNFFPTYTVIDNALKKKQIEVLRKAIKNASEVILATDDDREGEKISFCVAQIFKLDINKTKRITFNEITESAIKNAIKNPRTINMDIVNAQQARQVLDILVGFKVSPMLWKFITSPKGKENSLSAGRCQTPALKIIYDNDKDIKSAEERKVYNVTGYFTNSNLPFELSPQGKYETEDEIVDFLDGSSGFSHIYTCSQPVKVFKKQPEPFTTSRLQQVASNELHYSPKETMRVCQLLYEGGYITYMRTDSKTYSGEFIENVKSHITLTYAEGEKYINENINNLVSGVEETKKSKKQDLRQEAHEAIRPTNISLFELPETIGSSTATFGSSTATFGSSTATFGSSTATFGSSTATFGSKEKRMYKLIWTNTLESCMAPASFYSVTASISAFQDTKFTRVSELIDFPGWKIVAKGYDTNNKEFQYFQQLKQNISIPYKKICSKVTIKGAKQHYTEARLVQLLEENGIGRPSTFSSLVDKIQERSYVKKEDVKGREMVCKDYELENGEICEIEIKREFGNEKGKLVIQPLGIIVMKFLEKHFNDLFNYNYTSLMENELDKIAKGDFNWVDLCDKCNKQIDNLVDGLREETKFEYKTDDNNTYIIGKYGPVIKCVEEIDGKEEIKFKSIRKDVDIQLLEKGNYNVEDVIDTNKTAKSQFILGQHNGKDVIIRKGKFGIYMSWGENSKTLKELGNRPLENITFEEVKRYLEEGSNMIREINSSLSIRKGPKGDYLFYKSAKMKKPTFYDVKAFLAETQEDYKICDITILKSWISSKYNI
jgi:DNA topoisomerase-1